MRFRLVASSIASAGVLMAAVGVAGAGGARATVSHSLIAGSGSTWAGIAVNQWIADKQVDGLAVVYTSDGSAAGLQDFDLGVTDFGVTDVGADAATADPSGRARAYVPLVAGAVSFAYHLEVGGSLVRSLSLSPTTLLKIFTNQITDWSDPAITADNGGRALPSLPIVPVVHSEGSGASLRLTDWFDHVDHTAWTAYAGPGGATTTFPRQGAQLAEAGSDGVMNQISSAAGNGEIGYDEESYVLAKDYPAASVENASGHFVTPSPAAVTTALAFAAVNVDPSSPTYGLTSYRGVYDTAAPEAYPLSDYASMMIPTSVTDTTMTTAKRRTIADYLFYAVCAGQQEVSGIGYAPLSRNLQSVALGSIHRLAEADPSVDLTGEDLAHCAPPPSPSPSPSSPPSPSPVIIGHPTAAPVVSPAPSASASASPSPAPSPVLRLIERILSATKKVKVHHGSPLKVKVQVALPGRVTLTLLHRQRAVASVAHSIGRSPTTFSLSTGSSGHRLAAGRYSLRIVVTTAGAPPLTIVVPVTLT